MGFDWFGFVKPLSVWPVTNYGDLSGLPDPSLNTMANFTSPVLLVSGTADAYHTVTSMQKAAGDIMSFNVRQSLSNQPAVPLYTVSVQNAGSFVFFFSSYCINQFMSSMPQLTMGCQTNVPINWNFGAGALSRVAFVFGVCFTLAQSLWLTPFIYRRHMARSNVLAAMGNQSVLRLQRRRMSYGVRGHVAEAVHVWRGSGDAGACTVLGVRRWLMYDS
jgi:hypothetical protein